jgi:hypothetical protein
MTKPSASSNNSGLPAPPAAIDMERQTVGEALSTLQRLMLYSTSLPESLKSAGAYASEKVRESAGWLVPAAFRNSHSYSVFVQKMFEEVVKDWTDAWRGDVPRAESSHVSAEQCEQVLLAQKTVGSLLDMTALATFHVSPLTVLACYAEMAYDSCYFMQLLGRKLNEQGVFPSIAKISDTNSLLTALDQATGMAAGVFDQPPLSMSGLRKTIQETRLIVTQVNPSKLLPFAELEQLWRQMELAARDQQASIWDVSATMSIVALSQIQGIDQGGVVSLEINTNIYQQKVIDHYWEGLRAIERHGLLPTLSRASQPYLETVWTNYSVDRKTWTEQLLSGELIKWGWSQLSWPKLTR